MLLLVICTLEKNKMLSTKCILNKKYLKTGLALFIYLQVLHKNVYTFNL